MPGFVAFGLGVWPQFGSFKQNTAASQSAVLAGISVFRLQGNPAR
jgi:hypothetical protein|tara:strand:+ start:449 stop:583 length:135 start_codon:yes stop_codon:yes gene_type:complete